MPALTPHACVSRLAAASVFALACAGHASADRANLVVEDISDTLRELLVDAMPDEAAPASPLEARRQAQRAASLVRDTLNSEGYLDPSIDFAVEPGSPPRPMVRVDTGERFTVAGIEITYDTPLNGPDSEARAQDAIRLRTGQPAIAAHVLAQNALIAAALQGDGYAFAQSEAPQILGERDTHTIDVGYRITPGPQIRFGEVIITGNEATRDSFIHRLSPIDAGAMYDPDTLAQLNSRLSGTRLFSLASARLSEDATQTNADGTQTRNVIITLDERARHTVTAGAKFSTADGAGVTASWTRRNLTGKGDSLSAQAQISDLERQVELIWRRPNEFGFGRSLILSASLTDETTDAFDRQSALIGAAMEFTNDPRLVYTLGGNVEAVHEEDARGMRDIQVVRGIASARIDRSNDLLNATQGWRAALTLSPTQSIGDDSATYLRGVGQVSAYLPFGPNDRLVLAGRVRAGGVLGASAFDIPVRDRFYAGGGSSVRGFEYQGVGPRDAATNEPLGGRYLLESAIEARIRATSKVSLAVFTDGGAITDNGIPDYDELRFGAGFGVQYDTIAGPIRFDIATPLERRDGEDPVQIYLSIGQSF